MPRVFGNILTGFRPLRAHRLAAVLAALLFASGPVFAEAPVPFVAADTTDGPDTADDVENTPAVLSAVPRPSHPGNSLPGDGATGPSVGGRLPPRSGRAHTARPAPADPFGNGLGLRLRC